MYIADNIIESQDELGLSPFRPIFSICISDPIL